MKNTGLKKTLCVALLTVSAGFAQAGEYVCKVHCVSPGGSTAVVVNASSSSQAAQIVDRQSDQICRSAGYGRSTSASMSASQCSPK